MSAFMLIVQRLGLLGQQPPARITDVALDEMDIDVPRPLRRVLATLAHVGFGAGAGALYSLIRPGRPGVARAAIEGAAFGTAVWGASYAGWIPALGILPPPSEDRPGRPASMILAHWIFGAALGIVVSRLRRPKSSETSHMSTPLRA
jgi:hypothetical protein